MRDFILGQVKSEMAGRPVSVDQKSVAGCPNPGLGVKSAGVNWESLACGHLLKTVVEMTRQKRRKKD